MAEIPVGIEEKTVIEPGYFSFVREASHDLYLALEGMRHTPCAKQEDFERLIGIYSDLDDFMERIRKGSAEK